MAAADLMGIASANFVDDPVGPCLLATELIPLVRVARSASCPVRLAGWSMGGYGASRGRDCSGSISLVCATKPPDLLDGAGVDTAGRVQMTPTDVPTQMTCTRGIGSAGPDGSALPMWHRRPVYAATKEFVRRVAPAPPGKVRIRIQRRRTTAQCRPGPRSQKIKRALD